MICGVLETMDDGDVWGVECFYTDYILHSWCG